MQRFVGLIRGINVGGSKKIAMAELRTLLVGMGLGNPRTILQSGNFVFEAQGDQELQSAIAAEIEERLAVKAEVYIRTAKQWSRLVDGNPFPQTAKGDPSHLLAIVFEALPSPAELDIIAASYQGPESFKLGSEALYATFPEGIGDSRLSVLPAWKKLMSRGTARNWNTVLKIRDMLAD